MKAYIGGGSNLGDRLGSLERGVLRLAACGLADRVSSVWRTAPIDCDGEPFLNLVVEAETAREPREILDRLLAIERELGRVRTGRNGPRTLDLDLLLLGDRECDEPGLTLPHPRLWQRRFVLAPLAELAPGLSDPQTGHTVVEAERMLRETQPGVERIGSLALPERALL